MLWHTGSTLHGNPGIYECVPPWNPVASLFLQTHLTIHLNLIPCLLIVLLADCIVAFSSWSFGRLQSICRWQESCFAVMSLAHSKHSARSSSHCSLPCSKKWLPHFWLVTDGSYSRWCTFKYKTSPARLCSFWDVCFHHLKKMQERWKAGVWAWPKRRFISFFFLFWGEICFNVQKKSHRLIPKLWHCSLAVWHSFWSPWEFYSPKGLDHNC